MAQTGPQTIVVVYDGQVLRPEEPLDLEVNARYSVTIEPVAPEEDQRTAWDVLDELTGTIEAPPDWSAELDHYLYGTPKRHGNPDA
jgi:hypothetical protein